MNIINLVLILAHICSGLSIVEGGEARWTSKFLTSPDSTGSGSFTARAVSQDGRGNLFVAVEEEQAGDYESFVALLKVDSLGTVKWKITATAARGTPFDISVDNRTQHVFVLVSESKRKGNFARAHIIRFTNILTNNAAETGNISEEIFFSVGNQGTTKLFGCVHHPSSGDLYVAGGTTAPLYRSKSAGGADAFVVRLGPSGNILGSIQFGSEENEVGRSISLTDSGSALAVVTKRQFPSGQTISEIFRLDPQDLHIIDGPHSPYNHGADPLFNPKSISIAGPIASQANTFVAFVAGDALVRPDSQADIYIHIYTKIASKINEITITFDGVKRLKGVDSCVSANVGSDGNLYCLGFTELNRISVSRKVNLVVVSPTGELVFQSEREVTENIPLEETPTASTIIESENSRKLCFVGRALKNGKSGASIGFIELPKETIRTFGGFKDTVTGAGTVTDPTPANPADFNPPSIPVIAGAAAGGLAVLVVVIAGFVAIERRRRLDGSMSRTARTTTATEDYTREVHETFNDTITPREDMSTKGALV